MSAEIEKMVAAILSSERGRRMSARIEALAKAICAAQFPSVTPDYAWDAQFEDGKEEYRVAARLAVYHATNECKCDCEPGGTNR